MSLARLRPEHLKAAIAEYHTRERRYGAGRRSMTSLPRARRFDWTNLGLRVASGLVLAVAALSAVWAFDQGGLWRAPFLIVIAVAVALLAIEWASMAAPRAAWRVGAATAVATVGVILLSYLRLYPEPGCA